MRHGLGTRFSSAALRVALVALALAGLTLSGATAAQGATLLPGFQQNPAFSGLTEPMSIEFAPTGRIFVAEKSGIIKTYSSLSDTTATVVSDLRTNVHNYWDRGLMSIAVDPNYATNPYIYVYYVFDAAIGGVPPRWGTAGQTSDTCPTPPGPNADGCVVSGRISRIQVAGEMQTGPEQVLINDWCQQYPSHAGGGLEFGADGMLYYTGGDGSSFTFADYGQDGNPPNPCGDPPGGVGATLTPPTAEGGRLRAQDIRTSGDPLGLSGAVIRIDPATGAGVSGNPLFSSTNTQERKFIGYGMRNPFRLTVHPTTGDIWVADVGAGTWEEMDRLTAPYTSNKNFGWPCYEGGMSGTPATPTSLRFGEMDNLNLNLCENLYSQGTGAVTPPYWAYRHGQKIIAGENCNEGAGSVISAITFAPTNSALPDAYDNAVFFGDHSRECIWVMRAGANGLPDPATVQNFVQVANNPVDLEMGSDGNLYYADLEGGNIQKINFTGNPNNNQPTAHATANPQSSTTVPVTVNFSGTTSTDPDAGDVLTYAWDLDGDGQLDDSTSATPSFTYNTSGNYQVRLRVTDTTGSFDDDTLTVNAASGVPSPVINTPTAGTTWGVNQTINFTGSATDPEQGTLPGTALDWQLIINHCTAPGNCHQHFIQTYPDTGSGSFVAPDHEYPSTLELRLTATDNNNNSTTVSRILDPRTVQLTVASSPPGLTVSSGPTSGAAPITSTVIEGSQNTISTPSPQITNNTQYVFSGWSDGQGQTHNAAPTTNTTYTARFAPFASGTSTLTISPEADAAVEEATPTTNFGSSTTVRTDAGGNPDIESYLRFQVGGVVTAKIQSAKLRLVSTSNTVDGPAVYPTSNTWTESGINWNNKPAATGALLSDSAAIAGNQLVEWDVTPAVTGDGPVSFRLAQTIADGVNFHSRESTSTTQRPELVLTVLNDSYARPKGATPSRISLVPAFDACASPNRTHGPPLASPSCNPPSQTSPNVTIGTPDANAWPANSSGYVTYSVIPGAPGTPADEADMTFKFALTDVRDKVGLGDYTGELQVRAALRVTDAANGAPADQTGTLQDLDVPVTAPCTATSDPLTGADCGLITTIEAITPGLVDEGSRGVWEMRRVEVMDGGPDGDVDTADNTVFARQGVFVP